MTARSPIEYSLIKIVFQFEIKQKNNLMIKKLLFKLRLYIYIYIYIYILMIFNLNIIDLTIIITS